MTADEGTWDGSPEIDLVSAWQRCDGDACTDIGVCNKAHDTATGADAGHALRLRVTASNDGGKTTATSAPYAISGLEEPEPTTAPKITGSSTLGQRLTAEPGDWTNAPTFTYQRQQCIPWGACTDIAGATAEERPHPRPLRALRGRRHGLRACRRHRRR